MHVQGLDFLHSHGVIVMDIKPDNIFCNRSGTFQIGDFGMAVVSSLNWVRPIKPSVPSMAHTRLSNSRLSLAGLLSRCSGSTLARSYRQLPTSGLSCCLP